jgi:Mu transposase, C-terminal domain
MAKVTDVHVRRLFRLLGQGQALSRAARLAGIDRKTARRYRNMKRLPSEQCDSPRLWRTRVDPFAEIWPEVAEQLELAPSLQAKTLWGWLQQKYPGRFDQGQLRTLQRRLKQWRGTRGPGKEVYFRQVHHPGRLCASDFTHMGSLNVTIGGQSFDHLVYHFVLTYSNWESVTLCFSESFESLSVGLQNALWELGGVPERHRSDRMSSAVNNLSERRDFTERYQRLLEHYGVVGEKIQAREAHENGDVESSHRHFKDAVAQALLLRGSRDFASRGQYEAFLDEVRRQRNLGRVQRLALEQAVLRPLPARRLGTCKRLEVTVTTGSVIRVQNNVYSVNSRLIGERVEVRLHLEQVEVWYGQKLVETLPRLRGRGQRHIDYRHVIDTLVRKPGALANYCYREELFPSSRFRVAYDLLHETLPARADREYLEILHLAAHESEAGVEQALRVLIEDEQPINRSAVAALLRAGQSTPAVTAVTVPPADLASFDTLLTEVWDGPEQGREGQLGGVLEGIASALDAGVLRGTSPACAAGDAVLRGVSAGVVPAGVRDAASQPHRTSAARVADCAVERSAELRHQAAADEGGPASADAAGWIVSGSAGERFGVWAGGNGKEPFTLCLGARTDSGRTEGSLLDLQLVGAGTAGSQARPEAEQSAEEAGCLGWTDHRRHWLRAAEPRGNGGVVHATGGALRTRERAVDQQLAVLEVGDDLQGPDDDRRGHRSAGTPQRDPRTEHSQLSSRTGQEGDSAGLWKGNREHPRRHATGTGRPREPWGFVIVAHGER